MPEPARDVRGSLRRTPILILHDGACGLCRRSVAFLAARDRRGALAFAPLESGRGRAILARESSTGVAIDSMRAVLDEGTPRERVLVRSRAVLAAAVALGGPWRLLHLLRVVPTSLLDRVYAAVAARRHRWFGAASCATPDRSDPPRIGDA